MRFNERSPIQLYLILFGLLFGVPMIASFWGEGLIGYVLISLVFSSIGINYLVKEFTDPPDFEEKLERAQMILRSNNNINIPALSGKLGISLDFTYRILYELQRRKAISIVIEQKNK